MAAAKRLAIVRGSCCCSGTSPQLISISDQKENIAVAKCYHALQLAVQLASPFTRTEGLRPLKSTGSDGWLIQSFPMCYNPSSYRLFTRWIYDINNLGNVPSGTSGYSTSWRQTCRDLACTFISTVMITISYAFIKSNHKKKANCTKRPWTHGGSLYVTSQIVLRQWMFCCKAHEIFFFTLICRLNMVT